MRNDEAAAVALPVAGTPPPPPPVRAVGLGEGVRASGRFIAEDPPLDVGDVTSICAVSRASFSMTIDAKVVRFNAQPSEKRPFTPSIGSKQGGPERFSGNVAMESEERMLESGGLDGLEEQRNDRSR